MIKKDILNWSKILLDTSAIIHLLLKAANPNITNKNVLFTNKLIKYLVQNKIGMPNHLIDREFYVSSITISEISKANGIDLKTIKRIIEAIASENVVFVDFDVDTAELITSKYLPILGNNKKLNDFARTLSWPEHDLVIAREWILKDAMIIATADYHKCDIILTNDVRTFFPIAIKSDVYCGITDEEFWEHGDIYITKYKYDEAEARHKK